MVWIDLNRSRLKGERERKRRQRWKGAEVEAQRYKQFWLVKLMLPGLGESSGSLSSLPFRFYHVLTCVISMQTPEYWNLWIVLVLSMFSWSNHSWSRSIFLLLLAESLLPHRTCAYNVKVEGQFPPAMHCHGILFPISCDCIKRPRTGLLAGWACQGCVLGKASRNRMMKWTCAHTHTCTLLQPPKQS